MRVVLDTDVIYSALRSKSGASNVLLRLLGTGRYRVALSVALGLEYESVLKRQALTTGYTVQDVETLLDYLCAVCEAQTIYFLWRPQLRDPKDDLVLELAANAACSHIVTFNLRDFAGCQRFGVEAVTPTQFLSLLGGVP